MPVSIVEFETAFFYLSGDKAYHPELTRRLTQALEPMVTSVPLYTEYPSSGDTLAAVPEDYRRGRNGVIVTHLGGVTGKHYQEAHLQIGTLTDPEDGVEGDTFVMFMYFEGRDDRRKNVRREQTQDSPRAKAPPQLKSDVEHVKTSAQKPLKGVGFWDMHSKATFDFFRNVFKSDEIRQPQDLPMISLTAVPLMADKYKAMGVVDETAVVFGSDIGSLEINIILAQELGAPLIFAHKTRSEINQAEVENYYALDLKTGEIRPIEPTTDLAGKTLFGVDDMIDTGGTLCANIGKLREENHIKGIYYAATHAILSMPSDPTKEHKLKQALNDGLIDGLVITDSLPSYRNVQHPKVQVVSLVESTASLIKWLAGKETAADRMLIQRCLFQPQFAKSDLLEAIDKKRFPPGKSYVKKTLPQSAVLFSLNNICLS